MSSHLPILGPSHEWFSLKQAAHYSGKHVDTLRGWVKVHGICRQAVKNSKIDVSILGFEMVRCGDFEALELLRAGDRAHPRVAHYIERLTELGVIKLPEPGSAVKPYPTAPNPNLVPEVLLSVLSEGSFDEPAAAIATSIEREVKQMKDEGAHAGTAVRIRTIIRSKDGIEMPHLAEHLAFDTDLSEAESLKILEIAAKQKRSQIEAIAEKKRMAFQ